MKKKRKLFWVEEYRGNIPPIVGPNGVPAYIQAAMMMISNQIFSVVLVQHSLLLVQQLLTHSLQLDLQLLIL
jgi:hypothetical protein